ncbi:MAG: NAD-dependent epimerase/dehydratase family protein [Variovorax sp.]
MRVLVTGASGFLGRSVLAELRKRGLSPTLVSRRSQAEHERGWHVLSPGEAAAVHELLLSVDPEIIIHLAGVSSAASYGDLYAANVVFAANLLDASLAMPRKPRVLLAGSAAEYGSVAEAQLPVPESCACRPNTTYGISKLAQTNHALAARARGLDVTVARLFNPIGAGMPKSLALGSFADQVARMGEQGGTLTTGDLDAVRDFMDVDAAAAAFVELALREHDVPEIVNVCSGQGLRLLDVTRRLIELSGVAVTLRHDTARSGNSNVRAFVGDPAMLHRLGIAVPAPDIDDLLTRILRSARSEYESGVTDYRP